MRSLLFVSVLLALSLCRSAEGVTPCFSWWPWSTQHCPCPCCPDDYCMKPLPAVCRVSHLGPDDYCPTRMPSCHPVRCLGENDYCPKRYPIALPHCYPPWYTCGCPKAN